MSLCFPRMVVTWLHPKGPQRLERPLHLSAETWQVWCSQHLLLWAEHNIGMDKCSNTNRSPILREATCYQRNKTHISSTGSKALDVRKQSLSGLSGPCSLGLFVLVLQRTQKWPLLLRYQNHRLLPQSTSNLLWKLWTSKWAGDRGCTIMAPGKTHLPWLWEQHACHRGWVESAAQRPSWHVNSASPTHTDGLLWILATASFCWDRPHAWCFPICWAHTCCPFHSSGNHRSLYHISTWSLGKALFVFPMCQGCS